MARKRSFFEKLTGTVNADDDSFFESDQESHNVAVQHGDEEDGDWLEEEQAEAQLTVDLYQTPDELILKTIVAGVPPEDLEVSITREMVTITGSRQDSLEITEEDFYQRELFWGSFSRTVVLPEEIDVDEARAVEKHGMLTLHLPKLDKKRKKRLDIESK